MVFSSGGKPINNNNNYNNDNSSQKAKEFKGLKPFEFHNKEFNVNDYDLNNNFENIGGGSNKSQSSSNEFPNVVIQKKKSEVTKPLDKDNILFDPPEDFGFNFPKPYNKQPIRASIKKTKSTLTAVTNDKETKELKPKINK